MRILQLCHKPPFPANDGGTKAMHANTLAFQALNHQVDIITLETPKHPMLWEQIPNEYLVDTNPEVHFENTTPSKYGAIKAFLFNENYHIKRFDVPEVHALLSKKLAEHTYDVVWFESLYTLSYLQTVRKNSPKTKCIYRAHNIEYKLWDNRTQEYPGLMQSIIKQFNKHLKRFEVEQSNNVDGIAFISESDKKSSPITSIKKTTVLPYFPWETSKVDVASKPNLVRYIGALDWEPNIVGVEFLVNEVWPIVEGEIPNAKLEIAGRNIVSRISNIKKKNVLVLGEVDDACLFMQEASVLAVPLFSGSGIRIKLIEAASLGIPVVSTSKAASGLNFSEQALPIFDGAKSFANALVERLQDDSLRKKQADQLHLEYQQNYGRSQYLETMQSFLKQVEQ